MHPTFCDEKAKVPLVKSGANALFAVKCCVEHSCWTEFLDWRVCRDAVCPKMGQPLFLGFLNLVLVVMNYI